MRFWKSFVTAILGGMSISIGSAAYLALKDEASLAACLLFSVGFIAVVVFDFTLFTDKAGFLFERNDVENNIKRLFTTLIGNVAGALVTGMALSSRVNLPAKEIFAENYYAIDFGFFLSALIAGAVIYIAMHGYRKAGGGFTSCATLLLTAAIIPACDLEYAILDTFTIGAALTSFSQYGSYYFQILSIVLVSAIGNAIGAILFASLCRFKNSTSERHHRKHRSSQSNEKTSA